MCDSPRSKCPWVNKRVKVFWRRDVFRVTNRIRKGRLYFDKQSQVWKKRASREVRGGWPMAVRPGEKLSSFRTQPFGDGSVSWKRARAYRQSVLTESWIGRCALVRTCYGSSHWTPGLVRLPWPRQGLVLCWKVLRPQGRSSFPQSYKGCR